MIVVRTVFRTKWGKAEEVVGRLIRGADAMQDQLSSVKRARILTDLSGPFHTVVQELEMESLAEWETMRTAMFAASEFQQDQYSLEEYLEGGYSEYFTLEKTYEV